MMRDSFINISYEKLFFDTKVIKVNDSILLKEWDNTDDLVFYLIKTHNIPEYAHNCFRDYVYENIESHHDQKIQTLINEKILKFQDGEAAEGVIQSMKERYNDTWTLFRKPQPRSDSEIFGNAYLRLVDSDTGAMESIAKLELQFAQALSEKVMQRDMVLAAIDDKHMQTISQLDESSKGGVNKSSAINQQEQAYHKNRLQTEINWNSDITALREHQRRDFREYVMDASGRLQLEASEDSGISNTNKSSSRKSSLQSTNRGEGDNVSITENPNNNAGVSKAISNIVRKVTRSKSSGGSNSGVGSGLLTKLSDFNKKLGLGSPSDDSISQANRNSNNSTVGSQAATLKRLSSNSTAVVQSGDCIRWQESFTIHLGRQMRSSHNMRIVCADPFDILSLSTNTPQNTPNYEKLSPDDIASRINTALSLYSRNLTAIVLLVDNRLSTYTGTKRKFSHLCERSTDFHFPQLDNQLENISKTLKECSNAKSSSDNLEVGDVYITKHSNLNVVTVVFHLVVDENTVQSDIKFPSPVHSAIRNILRTCFLHDIFCITLPLLMTHYLKEYMDVSWCLRRVETILKAVKGALMELCTWRGRESRTIQFLVPPAVMYLNIFPGGGNCDGKEDLTELLVGWRGTSSGGVGQDSNKHTMGLNGNNSAVGTNSGSNNTGATSDYRNSAVGSSQLLLAFSALLTEYFQPSRAVR